MIKLHNKTTPTGSMKKIVLLVFLGIFSIHCLLAQCPNQKRYIDPVFQNVNITTGIKFGEANPYNPLVSNQELFLDIYEPVGDTVSKRPMILHAFGGGFLSGNRTGDDIPYWGAEYAKRGFVFVSVDYRVGYNPLDGGSTERAAYRCAQDINAAMRYMADHIQVYKLDINNFFLTGNSAGSIGGLITVFMDDNDRPASTFGTFFEPSDLGCMNCSGNSNFNNQKVPVKAHINLWGAVYDTLYIDVNANPEDNVPVISFHGTADAVVPFNTGYPYGLPIFPIVYGSNPMHIRLSNQGIRNELVPLVGMPHEPESEYPWVSDTIISKATRFIYPIVYGDSAKISGVPTLCPDSSKIFTAQLQSGSSYCWEAPTGQILSAVGNQVEVKWNSIGQHVLILTETDVKGVNKRDTLMIEIGQPPVTDLSYSGQNGLLQFTLTNQQINQALWDFGDGANSNLLQPTHQYTDTGFFNVRVIFKDNFCSADSVFEVLSNKCPDAAINYYVEDSVIYLYNLSELTDSILWVNPQAGMSNTDTISYLTLSNGTYPFILFAFNRFCSDSAMADINVLHCSKSDFTYSINGLSARFFSDSYNSFFYNWDFGNGNSSGEPLPPAQLYNSPGSYDVTLITYNMEGCSDTITKTIEILSATDITQVNDINGIKIFPVPASDKINIESNQPVSKAELINVSGQIIHTATDSQTVHIYPSTPDGLYFLKIYTADRIFICHLLIQK
jgi:PKD repeat protein/poly(3-hydroxybutyrate) depolymerase